MNKIHEWRDNLSILDGMDRLQYLIELAKADTSLPEELRSDDRLVGGCISKIWVDAGLVDDRVQVYYDSDAMITKGITHVVCDCYNGLTLDEAKKLERDDFEELGIRELLSAQRRNGLGSLIATVQNRVRSLA